MHQYDRLKRFCYCCRSKPDFSKSPDRKYIIYGLDDDVVEVLATDRSVMFVSASEFVVYGFQDLQLVETDAADGAFLAADALVESVGFIPRTDDPIIAYRPCSADAPVGCAAVSLVLRSGEVPVVGTRLFEPEAATSGLYQPESATSGSSGCDGVDRERVFAAPVHCAYTADASCALLREGDSIQSRDLSSSTITSLSVADVIDKMATVDGDNNRATRSVLMFAVSPKDSLIGLVYHQSAHSIHLFDAKIPAGVDAPKPVVVLKDDDQSGAVTDFSFLPSNGYVVSYNRKSGETLTVWNQKSGATVSRQAGVDVCYIRLSPASDRMAVSMRTGSGSELILRSGDNRFNVSLTTPTAWAAEPASSDVEFSGDGTVVVGFCADSGCIWNAGSGEPLRTLDGPCCSQPEVVGWPTNIHALLHDPYRERLLVVDVISGSVVAAAATDGPIHRKCSARRFRISPRGGVVVGSTVHGELRAFVCRNMTSVRRQSSLQAIRSSTGVTSPR